MPAEALTEQQRYQLVERIATGGMAEVFLAKSYGSHGFEKVLAIKRILPELSRSAEFEKRFISEAKIAVTLNHANIVQVLDFSRFGESLYIAMEYVDGVDLAALLKAMRPAVLPVSAALHVAIEMLKGLDFAHRRGVIHRDVSPSNVLVSRAGEVKIADFGIAQAADAGVSYTRSRRIMGKWRYMSPEQAMGEAMGAPSDLFSAAAVLYEVFTGQVLFAGKDAEEIVRGIKRAPIPRASATRPELPDGVDELLLAMLERSPTLRASSASNLLNELVDISYQRSLQATAMSLADAIGAYMPPSRDLGTADPPVAARLIDDILHSEVGGSAGGTTRVTLEDARVPEFRTEDLGTGALTFVGQGKGKDGITEWTLEQTAVFVPEDEESSSPADGAPVAAAAPFDGVADRADAGPAGAAGVEPTTDTESVPRAGGGLSAKTVAFIVLGAAVAVGVGVLIGARGLGGNGAAPSVAAAPADAQAPPSVPAPKTAAAFVDVAAEPAGGRIYLDGEATDQNAPARVEVEAGRSHAIEVRLDGHAPCRAEAPSLEAGAEHRVDCTLAVAPVSLTVTTVPKGARVALDGKPVGTTPIDAREVEASPGEHTLRISLDGHLAVTEKVELEPGKPVTLHRRLREVQRFDTIDIYVEPWAEVYFRGHKIGSAPQRGLRLPVGRHRIELVNPVQKRRMTVTVKVPSSKPYRFELPP